MLRRNFDFLAVAIVLFVMAVIAHIPSQVAVPLNTVQIRNAVMHDQCPLQSILRLIQQ